MIVRKIGAVDMTVFLATTAISDFWDTSKEIVFLGKWCLTKSNQQTCKRFKCKIMPFPWDNRERIPGVLDYLSNVREHLVDHLTVVLNGLHKKDYTAKMWEIILGPWLEWYLHIFYDRYVCLKEALDRHPDLETILLDSSDFYTPINYDDFMRVCCSDKYALQIYSQILLFLGNAFTSRRFRENKSDDFRKLNLSSHKKRPSRIVRAYIMYLLAKILFMWKPRIWIFNPYLKLTVQAKFTFKSLGKNVAMSPSILEDGIAVSGAFERKLRRKLVEVIARDEFEKCVIESLYKNLPKSYLEHFSHNEEQVRKLFPAYYPRVLATANSFYANEIFKIYAAFGHRNGTKLVCIQHGGGYGTGAFLPGETYERRITDYFISWGWSDNEDGKVIPMPSAKLSNKQRIRFRDKNRRILWVSTNFPRYLLRFFSRPIGPQISTYHEDQIAFGRRLNKWILRQTEMRLYFEDYGWNVKEKLGKNLPELHFDDRHFPLIDKAMKSRMVVIDHHATTLFETLSANIPTIIWWNPYYFEIHRRAEPYFKILEKAKIFFGDPISAAEHLNSVYKNVELWWSDRNVQNARSQFVDRFAKTSQKWMDIWVTELHELLNEKNHKH